MAGSSGVNLSGEQSSTRPRTTSKRNSAHSRSKVMFKSHTRSNSAKARNARNANQSSTTNRTTSAPTASKPVNKSQSRFASLFISLLAVSPIAIEEDAVDQKTMEAAYKTAVEPTQPMSPKKPYARPVSAVKPSEIRKTRWKRFRYELGLKIKSKNKQNGKGKGREKWTRSEHVELDELIPAQRETKRQKAKRDDFL